MSIIMKFISLPIYWIVSLTFKINIWKRVFKRINEKKTTLQHIFGSPCNGMQPFELPSCTKEHTL